MPFKKKDEEDKITYEDFKNGKSETFSIPLSELEAIDVSDKRVEKVARGFFLGNAAVGRRKDVRRVLEDKVIGKIGSKGKYLVDKLFELINGVYVVDSLRPKQGKNEIKYYQVPPNLQAIIYAIDRVLGKPKQVNLTGSFSLSKLLIDVNRPGQNNNNEVSEESSFFHRENMGSKSTTD